VLRSSYQERRVEHPVIKRRVLRSSYKERRVGDPVIKRRGLEIQLSRGEC
jgi:hypothetical protein